MALAKFVVDVPQSSSSTKARSPVVVEIDDGDEGLRRFGRDANGLVDTGKSFHEALAGLQPIARGVLDALREVAPQELQVEMGLKLSAQSGVILAKAGGEAHLCVKMIWKNGQPAQ